MASRAIEKINAETMAKSQAVPFVVGDNVKVHVRIKEGDKERVQTYAGTVIGRKGRGATETFTVRRISHGVGVERVFPIHSPYIAKIEIEGSTHVRRAKLHFLRDLTGKKARLREKIKAAATE